MYTCCVSINEPKRNLRWLDEGLRQRRKNTIRASPDTRAANGHGSWCGMATSRVRTRLRALSEGRIGTRIAAETVI